MKIITEEAVGWAQENKQVLAFLQSLIETHFFDAAYIFSKIRRIASLRGTNLDILFNILGESDPKKLVKICELVPDEVLAEACSGLFSGRELIRPYLTGKQLADVVL